MTNPDNEVRLPNCMPDYLDEQDREAGRKRGLNGIGRVHISMLRGEAGTYASTLSQEENPSSRMIGQNRERWMDEAANALEFFAPPQWERHRWSTGAPGIYCLDCGIDNAMEAATSCAECVIACSAEDDPSKEWLCPEHRALAETPCQTSPTEPHE